MDEEEKDDVQIKDEVEDVKTDEVLDLENDSVDEVDKTEQEDQSVPLSTYLELKNKYKSTKKEYAELKDKTIDKDLLEYKENIKNKYVKEGYNEDLAEMLANDLSEMRASIQQRDSKYAYIEEDIEDLSSDPIFRDIGDYKESIIEKIKETKKKGYDLTVEDAYIIVSRGNTRTKLKDRKINDTQREILNRKNKGTTTMNVATSSSNSSTPKYKLDQDDRKALIELQKMQPDAKWTPEKYYKMRHRE